jgi:spermidine synthase
MYADLKGAGFSKLRTLFFPQAIYPSGWWSATMAEKGAEKGAEKATDNGSETMARDNTRQAARDKAFRRADVQARTFKTRYYNADIHAAALAQPEFFRARLGDLGD